MQKGIYNKFWTVEDVALMKFWYPDHTNEFIANELNKTVHSIIAKAFKLRLIKNADFMRECAIKSPHAFTKGQKPHNAGRKMEDWMSSAAIEKSKTTRFKKGEKHINYGKGTGKLSFSDGTVYIKTGYLKREPYARYQYKRFIGEISNGDIVTFKDDNPKNCCPTNLIKISRGENMHRNSGVYNLPDTMVATYLSVKSRKVDSSLKEELLKHPDILEIKRLQLQLNRVINEHTSN